MDEKDTPDYPLIPPLGIDISPPLAVEIEVVGKDWWKSKTVWFNVGVATVEIVQLVGTLGIVPPGTIAVVAGVINIVLRRFTQQPLKTGSPRMVTGTLKPEGILNIPPGGLPPWMRGTP